MQAGEIVSLKIRCCENFAAWLDIPLRLLLAEGMFQSAKKYKKFISRFHGLVGKKIIVVPV